MESYVASLISVYKYGEPTAPGTMAVIASESSESIIHAVIQPPRQRAIATIVSNLLSNLIIRTSCYGDICRMNGAGTRKHRNAYPWKEWLSRPR